MQAKKPLEKFIRRRTMVKKRLSSIRPDINLTGANYKDGVIGGYKISKTLPQVSVGQKFVLRMDHSALEWMLNFKDPEGHAPCWIQQLHTIFRSIIRTSHRNAHALSQRSCALECKQCQGMLSKA